MKAHCVHPRKLNRSHIGKPMKVRLKNGKVLYGTITEIRKNGVMFVPSASQFFFPFFLPFGFFTPFIFF